MRKSHPDPRTWRRTAHIRGCALIVGGLSLSLPLAGQAQPTPPDAEPQAQSLLAKITALKGIVQVRDTEDQPWRPAAVGMELDEGAEFRTGPRSAVQFVIPPDQTITLDRLGTIKVLQAVKDAGKVTTALGMKYGRTRYDIQAADLEHDSTIRSPGSTLAIRGTDVTFEDMSPFPPRAVSREGRALFRTASRQFVAFGGTQRAAVDAEDTSPAQTAIEQTVADPQSVFGGRTDEEQELVLTLPSFGGADLATTGIKDIQEQAGQEAVDPFVPPAIELVPTDLLIELVWRGEALSDINLRVAVADEVVQLGSGVSATGGRHLGNGFANAAGEGREAIRWSPNHPVGVYQITGFGDDNSGLIDTASVFVTQNPDGSAPVRIAEFLDIEPPENQDFVTVRAVVPSPSPTPPPDPNGPIRGTTVAGGRRASRAANNTPRARNADVGRVREHSRRQR